MAFIVVMLHVAMPVGAQEVIHGNVLSATDGKSIPFVNIYYTVTGETRGTVSDIEGKYRLSLPPDFDPRDTVRFSCIGFLPKNIRISALIQNPEVRLEPATALLKEVVISPGTDPAYAVMKKVVQHREANRPESLPAFRFISYNKANIDVDRADSAALELTHTGFENAHLFMLESATEVIYQRPGKWSEKVLKKKISGISSPVLTLLSNSFQPFTCYDNYLTIAGFDYLNPVSPNSALQYHFTLRDTLTMGEDTIFTVRFTPRKPGAELLYGSLSVSATTYALVNFHAYSSGGHKLVAFEIRQAYAKTGGRWFPKESNTTYRLTDTNPGLTFIASSTTFIKDINTQYLPRRSDFGIARVNLSGMDTLSDSLWAALRKPYLTPAEKNTYAVYDTLPKAVLSPLNWAMGQTASLAAGRLNLGNVDLLIDKLIAYNPFEGFRVGAGLATSPRLMEALSLEAYAGYGFRDQTWKYGGGIRWYMLPQNEAELALYYRKDLMEPGQTNFGKSGGRLQSGETVHRFFIRQMLAYKSYTASFGFRPLRALHIALSYEEQHLYTAQTVQTDKPAGIDPLTARLASVDLRYTPGETLFRIGRTMLPEGKSYPRFGLKATRSLGGNGTSAGSFTRIAFQFEHLFHLRRIGDTYLFAKAGIVSGSKVDYPWLFYGNGVRGKSDAGIRAPGYFQTMDLYEFLSDKYVQAGFAQNFGPVFGIRKSWTQPTLEFIYNAAIGDLNPKKTGDIPVDFHRMDHLFLETGLVIDNLLRLKSTFYYAGYGLGIYYRHGYYALPETSANLNFVFTFAISL